LLGPRQTGKSTWLRRQFPEAYLFDLLEPGLFSELSASPGKLGEILNYQSQEKGKKLFIIDEIQSIPLLLNEVHRWIEKDKKLRFILTGSSARKIKRSGSNLLGGRLSRFHFHPLVFPEYSGGKTPISWRRCLSIGSLPSILNSEEPEEDLSDYVGLYLKEEIQAEGLTRSIENFSRFLRAAALCQGEQINFTQIGNDAQVPPRTILDYFTILEDTLTGYLLSAFIRTPSRKAMTTAKFFFFDIGVGNTLLRRKKVQPETPEWGKALEQLIFLELTAYKNYRRADAEISYWRSTSKLEVDFVIESGKDIFGIEVKGKKNPSEKDYRGLKALAEDHSELKKICVCTTDQPRKTNEGVILMPVQHFLKNLWAGSLF